MKPRFQLFVFLLTLTILLFICNLLNKDKKNFKTTRCAEKFNISTEISIEKPHRSKECDGLDEKLNRFSERELLDLQFELFCEIAESKMTKHNPTSKRKWLMRHELGLRSKMLKLWYVDQAIDARFPGNEKLLSEEDLE